MPIIQFTPKNARTKVYETKNDTLFGFMRQLIKQLNDSGHERTAETYNATLNSVARFTKGEDLKFDAINETWTITYEAQQSRIGQHLVVLYAHTTRYL